MFYPFFQHAALTHLEVSAMNGTAEKLSKAFAVEKRPPVCQEARATVVDCYKQNSQKPLLCSEARNFITWTDTLGGRLYLIRDGGLPKELFEMPKKEKVMPEVKKETIKGTDFDSHNDDDDDDDDDELMYTSDESSESNDESGDETYCGSGSAKEWKQTSQRSLQRKKRRREREERRLDRLTRRANGENRKARNFAAEEAPTYTEITKKLLSKDKEMKEMNGRTFTTESLANKFDISKSKTTNIIRIFNGLKIVKEVYTSSYHFPSAFICGYDLIFAKPSQFHALFSSCHLT